MTPDFFLSWDSWLSNTTELLTASRTSCPPFPVTSPPSQSLIHPSPLLRLVLPSRKSSIPPESYFLLWEASSSSAHVSGQTASSRGHWLSEWEAPSYAPSMHTVSWSLTSWLYCGCLPNWSVCPAHHNCKLLHRGSMSHSPLWWPPLSPEPGT